jgi:ribosomal protein S18 acetylase RimI-like enzyme
VAGSRHQRQRAGARFGRRTRPWGGERVIEAPSLSVPVDIRPLRADDAALAGFASQAFGDPSVTDEVVREELARGLEYGTGPGWRGGLGLWVAEQLVAVAVWRAENDPATVYRFGNKLWRNYVLAVRPDDRFRRRGYGIALKRALIDEARKSGITAITSFVSWSNKPMLELNKKRVLRSSGCRTMMSSLYALCSCPCCLG